MNRRDLWLAGGALLLLAIAAVRLAVPDRSRLRPLSIEGVDLKMGPVPAGQTITQETTWEPPDDVYILGWSPLLGVTRGTFDADLMLYDTRTKTIVFLAAETVGAPGVRELPPNGHRVPRPQGPPAELPLPDHQ